MPPAYLRGPDVPVPPPVFAPGCTGKVQQTRREAIAAQRRRRDVSRSRGSIYSCGHCGWWHTSHKDGQARHLSTEFERHE